MKRIIKKQFLFAVLILILGLFFVKNANAASLGSVSDTVTTSRPSASAPLASNQTANATQVAINDNGSIFLASDSATLQADTGQSLSLATVASMSASGVPSANQRTIYFNSSVANTHHQGTAIITPITATHTVKFTTNTAIPSGGKIVISFPGSGVNTASPSASTFSFNEMAASNPTDIVCFPTTACAGGISVAAPTITLTTSASQSTGTAIFILIGCTTQSSGTCTVFAPRLINPTKTATAGTADTWELTISTTDAGSIVLDTSSATIATIESVQVQATVELSMTFTISGVANGTSACSDTTNPGSGLDATATFVNLGSLTNSTINISAQTLTVNTNGASGYTISATSSGRFINPASGFWISDANGGNGLTAIDTPAPQVFPAAGNPAFGIHPCAAGSTSIPTVSGIWASGATAFSSGAKYSNPWNTGTNGYYANISSYNSTATNSTTTIEYAATVGSTTPAGTYSTVFTYVATPVF